jgi:hypothetical protein
MLKIETMQDDFVELRVSGQVGAEDYEAIRSPMEGLFDRHERIRALIRIEDFKGWTLKGFLEELRFDARHRRDFEKIAVVGEKKTQELVTRAAKGLFSGETRFFERSTENDTARAWIGDPTYNLRRDVHPTPTARSMPS